MGDDPDALEMIRANAALTLKVAREELGQDIGYDRPGVVWLDGFVERRRASDPDAATGGLVDTLGSYFGACLAAAHGGRWVNSEHGWAVAFGGDVAAYPFAKVQKQLAGGRSAGESVLGLFDTIPALVAAGRGATSRENPPGAPERTGLLGRLFGRRTI